MLGNILIVSLFWGLCILYGVIVGSEVFSNLGLIIIFY